MGQFINVGNRRFQDAVASEFVDKTLLIAEINRTLCTELRMSCVTRCRRFGKSMAATMLRAYYDKSCDSHVLFKGLNIEKDPTFENYLNKFSVIYLDMTYFITLYGHTQDIVEKVKIDLYNDLLKTFPEVEKEDNDNLVKLLLRIVSKTGNLFFMIIDEWDAICREFQDNEVAMDQYVDFLRLLSGDSKAVAEGIEKVHDKNTSILSYFVI
ncbi:MAG: AAA family ATPase [Bacteroidales bacterium]|nr:AAA family ATPase [Bacteroidales bacterium]